MKKIIILLFCILTVFIGFLLYNKVNQGIDAYNYNDLQSIDYTQVKTLPVDELDVFESYTHQLTTYPLFESNVLKSTQHYIENIDFKGLLVGYIDNDQFVINSFQDFSSVDKAVKNIKGAYSLVWSKDLKLKSGVQGDLYENDLLYYMLIQPEKVESIWFDFDKFSLELTIKDL